MGLDLVLDGSGNPIVAGFSYNGTNTDYLTIKYDGNGNLLWVDRYDNRKNDVARDLARDSTGNIYVTGWSEDSVGVRDYATIKYNTNGVRQWISRYNGPSNSHDTAQSVAIDSTGDVYVTGWSYNGSDFDYLTVKYDVKGNQMWTARYDNEAGDFGHVVRVDNAGNVVVAGRSQSSLTDLTYDVATVKYDTNGNQLWTRRYDRAGMDDMGLSLVLDASGNSIVAGFSNNGLDVDYLTIKYDEIGNRIWVKVYNNGGDDVSRGVTVDDAGNVYVTGWSESSGGFIDYATMKYLP
jgi:hypothetical protein